MTSFARIGVAVLLALASFNGTAQLNARDCLQPRFTEQAPDEYYKRENPFASAAPDLKVAAQIFHKDRATIACFNCHGDKGDGQGTLSELFDPRPRNFACAKTIAGVPDGQLFWIIRFGSPGTAMPANADLSDEQIWKVVLYLRQLSR
jgi:mono/diheme cytochrome c family protein